MNLDELLARLQETLTAATKLSADEVQALSSRPEIRDHSDPVINADKYWQSQVELLDSWVEDDDDVFHLLITARDLQRVIGGDVYWRRRGATQASDRIYEYVNGVPQDLSLK